MGKRNGKKRRSDAIESGAACPPGEQSRGRLERHIKIDPYYSKPQSPQDKPDSPATVYHITTIDEIRA
ncbi:hypothetical protein J1614_004048 [Plenodomus biglobosus]|nr:hypothetical protein J1614_004048 [Plenodomus biglobosus]